VAVPAPHNPVFPCPSRPQLSGSFIAGNQTKSSLLLLLLPLALSLSGQSSMPGCTSSPHPLRQQSSRPYCFALQARRRSKCDDDASVGPRGPIRVTRPAEGLPGRLPSVSREQSASAHHGNHRSSFCAVSLARVPCPLDSLLYERPLYWTRFAACKQRSVPRMHELGLQPNIRPQKCAKFSSCSASSRTLSRRAKLSALDIPRDGFTKPQTNPGRLWQCKGGSAVNIPATYKFCAER
jgi:hypothetical protein